jgi:folate-binding protein YgfZ
MASVVDSSMRARLAVSGADARAFLHRMSTQHVKDLAAGDGRLNALLTDKGRLVDLVLHLDRGEGGVLLLGHAGKDLAAWLDRYLFTEKVTLADLTSSGSAAELFGPGAVDVAEKLAPGASKLAHWGFVEAGPLLVARDFDLDGAPAFLVIDLERAGVVDALVAAGAQRAAPADLEKARVDSGAPGGGEITDAFTPLDLGMHDAIHWAKGCYIGQEVIARLDTYQKQHRRLVALTVSATGAAPAPLETGASVRVSDAVVGAVTSAAGDRGLAVVKLGDDNAAVDVEIVSGDRALMAKAERPKTAQRPHD